MTIIEDTRQKSGMHKLKHQHFEEMKVEIVRNMLPFGDYAPVPPVSVDTKQDMEEKIQKIFIVVFIVDYEMKKSF